MENKVRKITINDLDRSIYAFWHSILNQTEEFIELIINTDINIDNWHKMKSIQKNKDKSPLLEL